MNIKFLDGTELESLGVHGRSVEYQGVRRDCLTFLFDPAVVSLGEAMTTFTPERCKVITLAVEDASNVHENYTILVEVGQGVQEYVLSGTVNGHEPKDTVYVRMAQSTLAEREIMKQREEIDALLVASLEG